MERVVNKIFFMGKILTEPQYEFCYGNDFLSIAFFKILIENEYEIVTIGYDELADKIYKELRENDYIIGEGRIISKRNELRIVIQNVTKM